MAFGLLNAVDVPTRQSFTVEMVGRADLQSAIALNSIMFNMARVVGRRSPASPSPWSAIRCFAINAQLSRVLTSLFLMRVMPFVRPSEMQHPLKDIAEGFRYLIAHREICTALLALAVSSFAGGRIRP
ncbi:MAG: MFS transporter [Alphaproteobacteria bacterium]